MPENNRTVEDLMYETQFEGLSQYRTPFSYELAGKEMNFVFDDGKKLSVRFLDGTTLSYSEDGAPALTQKYQCMKAEDCIYMVLSEKKDAKPREGFILVIDTQARLVTGNFVKQGAVASFERLVTREVRFGYIDVPGRPAPTQRHHYTEDLVGKKVEWTYNPKFKITHVYKTKDTAHWAFYDKKMLEKMPDANERFASKPEPCIYVKLNDYMYIFSWIEENGGSGTEGFIVLNADRLHDVGCFFGVNPEGKPEAYCFAAYGKVIQ